MADRMSKINTILQAVQEYLSDCDDISVTYHCDGWHRRRDAYTLSGRLHVVRGERNHNIILAMIELEYDVNSTYIVIYDCKSIRRINAADPELVNKLKQYIDTLGKEFEFHHAEKRNREAYN